MEELPPIIIGVVIALIVLAAGVAAYFIILTPLFGEQTLVETFAVTDPTVTQTCTLSFRADPNSLQVEQWNGIVWGNVAATWVGLNVNVVTVAPGGMQG